MIHSKTYIFWRNFFSEIFILETIKQIFHTIYDNSIQKLLQKCYIKKTNLCFATNYSTVVITIYCIIKRETVVNHKKLVICKTCSFLQLCYIRGTCSKYFQNRILEVDLSSMTQKSTN